VVEELLTAYLAYISQHLHTTAIPQIGSFGIFINLSSNYYLEASYLEAQGQPPCTSEEVSYCEDLLSAHSVFVCRVRVT